MMKKRFLAILTAAVLFLSIAPITGCKKESYDFRVWYPKMTDQYKNLIDTPVYQELEKRTGVKAKYIIESSEKFINLFNQKDYPEVVIQLGQTAYPGGVDAAVREDKYIDLKPYIDKYAPNYKRLMESNPEIYRECFVNDGKIGAMYGITNDVQGPWYGYMMRKDFIDDYRAANPATVWTEYPVTYDDWEAFLLWVKNVKKVKNPLFLSKEGADLFEFINGGFNVGKGFYQVEGTVKFGPIEAE